MSKILNIRPLSGHFKPVDFEHFKNRLCTKTAYFSTVSMQNRFFDFFIFWGKGEKRKGFRVTNVNWGLGRGCTRWGDKSGIWRFYRRVWKNIFYERRDKERERGVLGEMERGFLGYVWEGM